MATPFNINIQKEKDEYENQNERQGRQAKLKPQPDSRFTLFGQTITAITGRLAFDFACTHPSGFFDNGKLIFTGGQNAELAIEVKRYTVSGGVGSIIVQEPLLAPFAPSDVFTVKAGCSRTYAKCLEYLNVINFRGEPFIIGMRKLLAVR